MDYKETKAICEKYDLLAEIDKVANLIEEVEERTKDSLRDQMCDGFQQIAERYRARAPEISTVLFEFVAKMRSL